jgi:hypothetical protein
VVSSSLHLEICTLFVFRSYSHDFGTHESCRQAIALLLLSEDFSVYFSYLGGINSDDFLLYSIYLCPGC